MEAMSELRELDIAIASTVMQWPRRDSDDGTDHTDTYFSAYNDGGQIVVYRDGSQRRAERWTPAQNIAHAFQVEDRIAELGLQREYVFALEATVIKESSNPDHYDASYYWSLIHASPEQRCRAALECVKEKAKAAGD